MVPSIMITGGLRGLGYVLAKSYLLNGYNVYVSYSNNTDKHKENLDYLSSIGSVTPLKLDLHSLDSVEFFWKETLTLDCPVIWINNAGISFSSLLCLTKEKQWDEIWTINAKHTGMLAVKGWLL